jgi:hypothetical protein
MNLTCFYCQTPFTLSMDQKIAALRKMHAENLHHYDAHCPRCGRANAISRERLEMFTPGWEEAIKEPAMAAVPGPSGQAVPAANMPDTAVPSSTPSMARVEADSTAPAMKKRVAAGSSRRRHAPAAKKAARKSSAKKATAKKATTKKTASKPKKKATTKPKSKSASRKTARKSKSR